MELNNEIDVLRYLDIAIIGLLPKIDRDFYHSFLFMCQNLQDATYAIDERGFTKTGMLNFDNLKKPVVLRANFLNNVEQICKHLLPKVDTVILHLPDQIELETQNDRLSLIKQLRDLVTAILSSQCMSIFTSSTPFDLTEDEQITVLQDTFRIPKNENIILYSHNDYKTWHNLLRQATEQR